MQNMNFCIKSDDIFEFIKVENLHLIGITRNRINRTKEGNTVEQQKVAIPVQKTLNQDKCQDKIDLEKTTYYKQMSGDFLIIILLY